QTGKMSDQVPVILIGKDYWSGLLKWITETMQDKNHFIEPFEFEILRVVDSVDEAFRIIKETHERTL
ncbi:MAG TPA: LOG family protein, partial [Verrucomicrobiae bacterium]|nr:LOG family protein [Verrucomicrobiae bacterium]